MFTVQIIKSVAILLLLICLQIQAHAFESIAFELAGGNQTQISRIAAQSDWVKQLWHSDARKIGVGVYWDFAATQWRENRYLNLPDSTHSIFDLSITPIFRLKSDDPSGLFAEAGIGIHYLSNAYDNNGRKLSGSLQFGSHVGVGYAFNNKLDISLNVQHVSNGGIRHPNDGVNFVVTRMRFHF